MPLTLEDGTLYGVLGIEMLDDYLCSHLPYGELGFDADGSYMVAQLDKSLGRASVKMVSGKTRVRRGETLVMAKGKDGGYVFQLDGKKYVTQQQKLSLYDHVRAVFRRELGVDRGGLVAEPVCVFQPGDAADFAGDCADAPV